MDRLINALKGHAAQMDAGQGQPGFGLVASYNPADHTAKVTFFKGVEDAEFTTGWLPIVTPAIGSGWGLKIGLMPGQQVFVARDMGAGGHPVILGGAYNTDAQPPKTKTHPAATDPTHIQGGETGLVHASGAVIRLNNDGTIYMQAPTVFVLGDLKVKGDIYDHVGKLDGLRTHYDQHVHTGVQSGGSNTGPTTAPDPGGDSAPTF